MCLIAKYLPSLYEQFMNRLFELYGFWYPMNCLVIVGSQRSSSESAESAMFATTAITLLCTAGIPFYVRFLIALCKKCKPRRIGYWVRVRLASGEESIPELRQRERPGIRAA
jgi:hypothetical protein